MCSVEDVVYSVLLLFSFEPKSLIELVVTVMLTWPSLAAGPGCDDRSGPRCRPPVLHSRWDDWLPLVLLTVACSVDMWQGRRESQRIHCHDHVCKGYSLSDTAVFVTKLCFPFITTSRATGVCSLVSVFVSRFPPGNKQVVHQNGDIQEVTILHPPGKLPKHRLPLSSSSRKARLHPLRQSRAPHRPCLLEQASGPHQSRRDDRERGQSQAATRKIAAGVPLLCNLSLFVMKCLFLLCCTASCAGRDETNTHPIGETSQRWSLRLYYLSV